MKKRIICFFPCIAILLLSGCGQSAASSSAAGTTASAIEATVSVPAPISTKTEIFSCDPSQYKANEQRPLLSAMSDEELWQWEKENKIGFDLVDNGELTQENGTRKLRIWLLQAEENMPALDYGRPELLEINLNIWHAVCAYYDQTELYFMTTGKFEEVLSAFGLMLPDGLSPEKALSLYREWSDLGVLQTSETCPVPEYQAFYEDMKAVVAAYDQNVNDRAAKRIAERGYSSEEWKTKTLP